MRSGPRGDPLPDFIVSDPSNNPYGDYDYGSSGS